MLAQTGVEHFVFSKEKFTLNLNLNSFFQAPGLPDGWHILEEHQLKVPMGSSQRAVARTLVFQPEIH